MASGALLTTYCQVVAEAEELLGGSFYAGRLDGEPGCEAHAFLEADQVNLLFRFNLDAIMHL